MGMSYWYDFILYLAAKAAHDLYRIVTHFNIKGLLSRDISIIYIDHQQAKCKWKIDVNYIYKFQTNPTKELINESQKWK